MRDAAPVKLAGVIVAAPSSHLSHSARPCVRATLATDDGERIGLVAFSKPARKALSRLTIGESVTVSGVAHIVSRPPVIGFIYGPNA